MNCLHYFPRLLLVIFAAFLASCSGNKSRLGPPANLAHIGLQASTNTPAHNMSATEYPFAPNGDYISSWAAAGGGGPAADDYAAWRSSHQSSSSSRGSSTVRRSSSGGSSSARKSSSSSKSSSRSIRHTVKKGDTLSGIARKYGSSVARIKAANGLKSDMIRDGRTLVVPK